MKRDWDLVRKALFDLEAAGEAPLKVEDREMMYTYKILEDGGYVTLKLGPMLNNGHLMFLFACNLTWQGHELLDSIRRDTVWNKVKNKFGSTLASLPVDVVKALAIEYLKFELKDGN